MNDFRKMRRGDREITDMAEILDVLRRVDVIRLGLNGDPYPYVVPLSFGFEPIANGEGNGRTNAEGGDGGSGNKNGSACITGVTIYVHGALEGHKHDLIARDSRVCVEADIFHRYAESGPSSLTTEYESFIGFGAAEAVTGAEAEHGAALILEHCGYAGFAYDKVALDGIRIYKFTLSHITGKRRFV